MSFTYNSTVVLFIGALAASGLTVNIIRSVFFDFNRIRSSKQDKPIKQRKKISIIIPTDNNQNQILACLESIIRSNYRKYQIIIIDNQSSDETLKLAKNFIENYPKKDIKIIKKNKPTKWSQSLGYARNKYINGDLILTISADQTLEKNALRAISDKFIQINDLGSILLGKKLNTDSRLTTLIQIYLNMKKFYPNKLSPPTNFHTSPPIGYTLSETAFKTIYTRQKLSENTAKIKTLSLSDSSLIKATPKDTKSLVFDIYKEKIAQIDSLFTKNRASPPLEKIVSKTVSISELLLLNQPLVFVYFFILGLAFGSPILFFVGWLGCIISLSFKIWDNRSYGLTDKITLSLLLPVSYILLIVYGLVEIVATLPAVCANLYRLNSLGKHNTLPERAKIGFGAPSS